MLVTPQGFFDARAVLDVRYDAVPFDDVSICVSQWHAPVQMPSILPIGAAKTNLAFMGLAARHGGAPFALMPLKIVGVNCLPPPRSGGLSRPHPRVLNVSAVWRAG